MRLIRCTARSRSSPPAISRPRWRNATAHSARPSIRRCWRGSISNAARASPSARRRSSCATSQTEPDKLAGGIGFGPRLLISEAALRATGLCSPAASCAGTTACASRADANDRAAHAVVAASEKQLPDAGWEVRTRANASPALGRNIERFTQYLTLVGLTALLVGGVGVANAVKHYLDRRREVIATLKSLGATGGACSRST
jgi:predicted lysophospholipase L1 biosynthesis ABC-type transport system permease subunit